MTHGLDVGEGGRTDGVWVEGIGHVGYSKQVARKNKSKHQGNKSRWLSSTMMENSEA